MSFADIDPEALPPLRAQMQRFRARLPEILDGMDGEISRADRLLSEHCAALERRARRLRRAAEEEGDNDTRWRAEQRADEAEDDLRRLRHRLRELGQLVSRYRADARRARAHCEGPTAAACSRLTSLHGLALAALAIRLPTDDAASALPATVSAGTVREVGSAGATEAGLAPLPVGFTWIPIDRAHPGVGDWPTPTDFRKGVSYEEVLDGTRRLHEEVLPIFGEHPNAGREVFEEFDRRNGRVSTTGLVRPDSLAHLYDQFFGEHNRMVCWQRSQDGLYEFGNGRHRVRVAMDLGLKFVPAQVQTGSRP